MSTIGGSYVMETVSGRAIDLSDPNPAVISLRDIAHHLSQINRFTGATSIDGRSRPISVAEHAVTVATRLRTEEARPEVCLAGLHHDDAEAYLGDVSRPLKALLPGYRKLEDQFEEVIADALNLPEITDLEAEQVKEADNWALSAEAWYLMPSKGEGWFSEGLYAQTYGDGMAPEYLDRLADGERARRRFLHMDEALRRVL